MVARLRAGEEAREAERLRGNIVRSENLLTYAMTCKLLYLPALSSSLPVVTDAVDADSCAAAALAEPELEPALFLVDSGEGDLCRLLLPGCRAGGLKIFTPQGLLQIVVIVIPISIFIHHLKGLTTGVESRLKAL